MVIARAREVNFEIVAGALVPALGLLIITAAKFGLRNGLLATALGLGSLFVHEAGHAAAALITRTRLSALGFCLWGSYIRRERAYGMAEFFISAAGPAMNIAIIALLWNSTGILGWLAQFNVFLALVNLIPHRGSDGRRMLATFREIVSAPGTHNKAAPSSRIDAGLSQ